MNRLIEGFKDSAHVAGEICGFPNGKLIRRFGLGDFLENAVAEEDDAPAIAMKALAFFCKDANPHAEIFRFGVLTVGSFLNHHYAKRGKGFPQQALRDLVALLTKRMPDGEIRNWIAANFE